MNHLRNGVNTLGTGKKKKKKRELRATCYVHVYTVLPLFDRVLI